MSEIKIGEVFEHEGQKYLKVAEDKAMPIDGLRDDGTPIVRPRAEEIVHLDGRKDVKMHVPLLTIKGQNQL